MNDQERAEEHLKTIRRLMERATIYRAISAPTALVGSLLSLAASAIYLRWFGDNAPDAPDYFIYLWLLVLVLTAAANTLFIVIGANKRHEPVFSPSMKAALTALAPAFIAGAAFTFAFAAIGWDVLADLVMSIGWPVFYGLGLLATSHFAPRSLTLLGWAFLISSIVEMMVLRFGDHLPFITPEIGNHLGIYFMAITFGLFHLIYAACTWPRKSPASEP
jgi:lysylphosphatidylglycerol synthetase-like protein (DUF2156 family)